MSEIEVSLAIVKCLARRAAIAAELRGLRRAAGGARVRRSACEAVATSAHTARRQRARGRKAAVQQMLDFDGARAPWE